MAAKTLKQAETRTRKTGREREREEGKGKEDGVEVRNEEKKQRQ